MKKVLIMLLAILMFVGVSKATLTLSATDEEVYEKATDDIVNKYINEAEALTDEIINSKSDVKWTGTAYYISANGSDTNDGLTPETAWRSPEKIKTGNILKSGDAVLFERGSVFRLSDSINTKGGVTYSAYGSGSKPLFIGSVDASSDGSWEETDIPNVYKFKNTVSSDVGVIVFDRGEATGVKLISLLDNGEVNNGLESYMSGGRIIDGPEDIENDLEFWHDPVSKNVYILSKHGSPNERFVSIELVDYGHAMRGDGMNVTIDNLSFFGFGSHCIGYGSATGLRVQYCTFDFIGGSIQGDPLKTTTRYGNAIEIYGSSSGFVIDHCFATNVYDCCWTIQCGDGGFVFENVEFSNNVAMYSSTGPEIWLGDSLGSGKENKMENVRIHHNYTLFSGYGWTNQRPAHKKQASILYGGTGVVDAEYINMSMDNNVGIFPSHWLYYARYISPEHGYNLNNNVYIQHSNKFIGGLAEEPVTGTGGIGGSTPYSREAVLALVEMGIEPGSKFYYVDKDFEVPKYEPETMNFNDITKEHWAYKNIKKAVTGNLFKGTGDNTFSPDTGMTRGMLVTVLARLAGVDTATNEIPFKDVAKSAWFYPTVKWAYNLGVIEGGDKFRPDDMVTREELADMLYKYTLKQYKTKAYDGLGLDFKDAAEVSAEYAPGVAFATANGIITGYPDGTVKPQNGATRAEVATMIGRFVNYYADLVADYNMLTTKTDSKVYTAEELSKLIPNPTRIINGDINPTLRFDAENTRAKTKKLSIFERFLKINFAEYPYIRLRYKTDIKTDIIQVAFTKAGKEESAFVGIESGDTNTIIINYYEIMKPYNTANLEGENGSLVIAPWASLGEWDADENSFFDIEYIACFPTLEAAENYKSEFEADSVEVTFMNGNDVYATVGVRKGEKFTSSLVDAIEKPAYKFIGWSLAEGTVLNENTCVSAVFEKILGEPIAMFTPENARANASGGLEVSNVTEDGVNFFRFSVPSETASKDNTRAELTLTGDYDVSINKVMKFGYRTNIAAANSVELNFTFGTRRLWTHYIKYLEKGKWCEGIVDLSAVNYTGGQNVISGLSAAEYFENYVKGNFSPMFKPYGANGIKMSTTDTFDIAYVAFFDTVEDAQAFKR